MFLTVFLGFLIFRDFAKFEGPYQWPPRTELENTRICIQLILGADSIPHCVLYMVDVENIILMRGDKTAGNWQP